MGQRRSIGHGQIRIQTIGCSNGQPMAQPVGRTQVRLPGARALNRVSPCRFTIACGDAIRAAFKSLLRLTLCCCPRDNLTVEAQCIEHPLEQWPPVNSAGGSFLYSVAGAWTVGILVASNLICWSVTGADTIAWHLSRDNFSTFRNSRKQTLFFVALIATTDGRLRRWPLLARLFVA